MYEIIARYYDLFMSDDEWVDFAVNAVKGKYRGADVGCGSGSVAAALAAEHDVIAVDSSAEMLTVAAEKFMKLGLRIPTVLQNAEKLSLGFKADFITAMCDVVNYIRKPEKFFSAAQENLVSGGLLVFDISSEEKLRNVLGDNVFTETKDNVTYVWENSLERDRVNMLLTFFIPCGNGLFRKEIDEQTQYIHGKRDIEDALSLCGFESRTIDKGDRIYFVAKKV